MLLATKLYIPAARTGTIPRQRLLALLDAGVNTNLTLVAAPAGYGKSTLVAEWLVQHPRRTAWLSLDEHDNHPVRFWRYVIAALEQAADEAIGAEAGEILTSTGGSTLEQVVVSLINDLAAQSGDLFLVLDDYHTIDNETIHDSLQLLLDNHPPPLHLMLLTRVDPPLRLARLRAQQRLTEIRADALQFTGEETTTLMNDLMGLALDPAQVAALTERTEGWITGLQLVGLSLKSQPDQAAFIQQFTGSHRYILDYLTEEVLRTLPSGLRDFLLQTAVLDRMCPDLCEAITRHPDSHRLFDRVCRKNLFLIPLDSEGLWFRYHHLFSDLLRARLKQYLPGAEIAALHRRASEWYEGHDLIGEAVQHARLAGDFDRMASLVDQAASALFYVDNYTLKSWLDQLPAESFHAYPRLEVHRILIDLSLGSLDMSEETLRETEQVIQSLPPSSQNDRLRLEAMAHLCLFFAHQNTARTIRMVQEVLTELPDDNLRLRAFLFSALYRAYGMEGNIEKSAPSYRECLRLSQTVGDYGMGSVTTMVRAFDLCQYGRLDEAAQYCRTIIDAGQHVQQRTFYQAGPSYIGLGGIHLERYELQPAEDCLTHGIELCRRSGMDGLYTGLIQKARLFQAKGDYDGALEALHLLETTIQRWDFTLTARQVSLWLAMGDIDEASRLAALLLNVLNDRAYARTLPLIAQEAFKLCIARIYIAQEALEQARSVLDEIQPTIEAGQRDGRLLEVYLLRAMIARNQQPDHLSHQAVAHLERALELAEPAGFVLLFLEEGEALIPLLNAVSRPFKPYARKLLNAFAGNEIPPVSGEAAGLAESLTPREMEVLRLIAIGDSNQAIADKLFITVRTVKKHTTSILGKLDASNRTQAVARARELGLIMTG